MKLSSKIIQFLWPAFLLLAAIIFLRGGADLYDNLTEEQRTIASTVFAIMFGWSVLIWLVPRHVSAAFEQIREVEAREDGLATEYPGYGYLRSAHREIFQ